jgi:hypothetical protein
MPTSGLPDVLEVYSLVLNVPVERIAPDTSFFLQGGTSLRAAILLDRLHRDLGAEVPKEVFWLGMSPREVLPYLPGPAPR